MTHQIFTKVSSTKNPYKWGKNDFCIIVNHGISCLKARMPAQSPKITKENRYYMEEVMIHGRTKDRKISNKGGSFLCQNKSMIGQPNMSATNDEQRSKKQVQSYAHKSPK